MVYTLYAGCSIYDACSNSCTSLHTTPDFGSINYSVTTHIPGEYLVNLLHNILYNTETGCTTSVKPTIFNLHDIPYDLGRNSAKLNGNFSSSYDTDPIVIDDEHVIPFDRRYTTVASAIPKVMGKQFPFTGGVDHNIRIILSEKILQNISKFSFKDYGSFDSVSKTNSSLQGLVRSSTIGHDIVKYFEPAGRLVEISESVNIQFVLRLTVSHGILNMRPNPTHITMYDDGEYSNRALILYNFVFDPTISIPYGPLVSGTSWVLDTTYAPPVSPYSFDFVKYSNNGLYALVGDIETHVLMIYKGTDKLKKVSVKFTNAVISNNGTRFVTVDERTGKIMVKHLERDAYAIYYKKTYGYGFGRNLHIDDSGSIILVSQSEDLYSDVFSGKVFTLVFDGQIWKESVVFQSVISDINYLGYGMSVSNDSVFVAFNKHRLDTTTTPYTASRFVEVHKCITDGTYKKVGPVIRGNENFGNILKISKNGRRLAVWDSVDIKVFEYDGSDWIQVGQPLPVGTNISISDDGGSLLIDNKLYKLN